MKIYFYSNFFNHHQKNLCDALFEETNGDFYFIETSQMPQERIDLGYSISKPHYVVEWKDFKCTASKNLADAVIMGSAPEECLKPYIEADIPVFRFSERPLRKGIEPIKYPIRWFRYHKRNPSRNRIYLLCTGAFTALDYKKFGMFKNKMFRWGYFPPLREYENYEDIVNKKNKTKLLWVGRYIKLKHPEHVLMTAKRLKDDKIDFTLDFIGAGDEEESMRRFVKENDLDDRVSILNALKPDEVRSHMEKAGIFLFTSDKREGWGAVLNEAMNSCCAVVATNAVGSVPYMIKNGKNGLVYQFGDIDSVYEKIKCLLENPIQQEKLGTQAYLTIKNEWNARSAAKRLVNLINAVCTGDELPFYSSGPCSKAEIIGENTIL